MKPGGGLLRVTLTISSTQTALYDMRAAYLAAGHPPNARVIVTLVINAICQRGIDQCVGSPGWPAGSSCVIDNNSYVCGYGGGSAGIGVGADAFSTTFGPALAGMDGGDALSLRMPTIIDNGAGYFYGGGGQGGGGGAAADTNPPGTGSRAGGGGGGGGQGYNNASGGNGGYTNSGGAWDGTDGANGSSTGGGAKGTGGVSFGNTGGNGGNGGGWGANGQSGASGVGTRTTAGKAGGAAGYAIRKNGYDLTITAGNNSTQIKGAVA